jgi:hypothetical protein
MPDAAVVPVRAIEAEVAEPEAPDIWNVSSAAAYTSIAWKEIKQELSSFYYDPQLLQGIGLSRNGPLNLHPWRFQITITRKISTRAERATPQHSTMTWIRHLCGDEFVVWGPVLSKLQRLIRYLRSNHEMSLYMKSDASERLNHWCFVCTSW